MVYAMKKNGVILTAADADTIHQVMEFLGDLVDIVDEWTLADFERMVKAADREKALRSRVYTRLVANGKMTAAQATQGHKDMADIHQVMEALLDAKKGIVTPELF